jgi:hypothetical protein
MSLLFGLALKFLLAWHVPGGGSALAGKMPHSLASSATSSTSLPPVVTDGGTAIDPDGHPNG